jgi:hypothetical protein
MSRRLGLLLGAVAVLGAGAAIGVALWSRAERQRVETEIAALVGEANAELGREELVRSAAAALSGRIANHAAARDPRLISARARLELALDRVQNAWELHAELATRDPTPEDLLLSALILKRRGGLRGELGDAETAMRSAAAHTDRTGDPGSLFLAWQCAVRAGLPDQVSRFATQLTTEHSDTIGARLVQALLKDQPSADELRALEIEFASAPVQHLAPAVPEELELALAVLALESGAGAKEALPRLDRILARDPSWVEARHAAALAYHQLGDRAARDSHLQWLLANARPDDQRQDGWHSLLAAPVGG